MSTAGRRANDCHVRRLEGIDVAENVEDRAEKAGTGKTEVNNLHDAELPDAERESEAEAVAAERTGRTNTARDMTSRPEQEPPPGRWDSIGEHGAGLDELQGLYAADATGQEQLPQGGDELATTSGSDPASASAITLSLWDQLLVLEGAMVETPKGEPFRVIAVTRGISVTVSPLDGAQEWDVPVQELEAGWLTVSQGTELDRLASIRLQEAGLESAHPEYVAGLLQAIFGRGTK